MDVPTEKTRLRAEIRKRIKSMDAEDRRRQSEQICSLLRSRLPNEPCGICAYAPLPDEIDIRPLLRELLERQYILYLPRYVRGTLVFHRVTSLDELAPGSLAVHEPPHHAPPLDPQEASVVLVPGRAFDAEGNRLGRGKGGYDRWMTAQRREHPRTRFWGVAFREQIVEQVPVEEHDQRVDRVIAAD